MHYSKSIIILIGLFLFITACKDKSSKSNLTLSSIDFNRGELILCGDGQFGELNFSLSCNWETRETFDLAVALLHSFEYNEAEKAFVKVIDTDPNCPMAYWGVAMSIYHAAWFPPSKEELIKGNKVLEIAKKLSMDDKQRDYINAIDAFYTDWKTIDHKTRAERFESKMGGIYLKYPEDIEAAIFYSLALYSTRDRVGTEYVNERKAGIILESLFAENPNHPGIAHYIIHNYDTPELAHKALETARRYAKIAPSSAHAQHMPSHIFTRLGIWQESIETNLNAVESSRFYEKAAALNGVYNEELHALDYLIYAYLQKGDNINAISFYNQSKDYDTFHSLGIFASCYAVVAIPARIALENKNWEQAASLKLQKVDFDWKQFPWQEAIHHFAVGMGAVNTKDFDGAEYEIIVLKELHQNLVSRNEKADYIQIRQIEIQFKTVQAWLAFTKNNLDKGITLMQEAAELERNTSKHPVTPGDVLPAIELLGDMLLQLNRPEEALAAYEENLKKHPGRFNGVYGAAVAAMKSGNIEKAQLYFNELIELTKDSNSNRVEITEAKSYLEKKTV